MIEALNLVKDFGPIRAVDGVSFHVPQGEILAFLGPNGAGKSTTMKMVTGFLRPTSGSARIGGFDVRTHPREARRLLGYLPESGPLYGEMTVVEFLSFCADLRGLKGEARRRSLARVMDLCHLDRVRTQPIDTLSKGFRQRVGMAHAFLHDPSCLILDEPTDGLDPNQKHEVRKLIASMAQDKAIILSTHILEEVEAMCTRVIIIDRGKLLFDGSPSELRQRHPQSGAWQLRTVNPSEPLPVKEALSGATFTAMVEEADGLLTVYPAEGVDLGPALLSFVREQGWTLQSIEPVPMRLDEVFRDLTRPRAA